MLLQGDLDEAEATVNELNNEIPRQQDILEQVPTILQRVSTILKSLPIILDEVLFEKVVTSITYLFFFFSWKIFYYLNYLFTFRFIGFRSAEVKI